MMRHNRPQSFIARLGDAEDFLSPRESIEERRNRELWLRWLLSDPNAADLLVELEAVIEEAGGLVRGRAMPAEVLDTAEGRAAVLAVSKSLWALER